VEEFFSSVPSFARGVLPTIRPSRDSGFSPYLTVATPLFPALGLTKCFYSKHLASSPLPSSEIPSREAGFCQCPGRTFLTPDKERWSLVPDLLLSVFISSHASYFIFSEKVPPLPSPPTDGPIFPSRTLKCVFPPILEQVTNPFFGVPFSLKPPLPFNDLYGMPSLARSFLTT